MKAVFQSDKSYIQIAKSAFVGLNEIFSEEMTLYSESGQKVTYKRKQVGKRSTIPPKDDIFYIFQEGENHNQLTLADPEEIAGMREFIKEGVDYIREISFDE